MEKIDIKNLGKEIIDTYPQPTEHFNPAKASQKLAEKVNEIVEWINVKMGLDNIKAQLEINNEGVDSYVKILDKLLVKEE